MFFHRLCRLLLVLSCLWGGVPLASQGASPLDSEAFKNPDAVYRPLQIIHGPDQYLKNPGSLEGPEGIGERLDLLRSMGVGGIVTNVGSRNYLMDAKEWDVFRLAVEEARKRGMPLWLYDEKGYPSGTAGGIVTRSNPELAAQGIACYTKTVKGPAAVRFDLPESCRAFAWVGVFRDKDTVEDLCARVNPSGTLLWDAPEGEWTVVYLAHRYMYEGTHASGNVSEFKQYINVLDPRATAAFLRVTHERYLRELSPEAWSGFRAIFTDEPSFMASYVGPVPQNLDGKIAVMDKPLFEDRPPAVPWVHDLPELFQKRWGYDLRPRLWHLFFSDSPEACVTRQNYYELITERYADAYFGQIQDWCRAHGIAASGHPLAEENILGHVLFEGSILAVLRRMDLPGIDMLNSEPQQMLQGSDFIVPLQAASAARLTGARLVQAECSDWSMGNSGRSATVPERRGQANILYALGVNVTTSYWGWNTIGEEGYRAYNDYVGRLSQILQNGEPVCDVAVLYPIRSAWALVRPVAGGESYWEKLPERARMVEVIFKSLVRLLAQNQIPAHLVDEQALREAQLSDGQVRIGNQRYRCVILPSLAALDLASCQQLERLAAGGVTILSAGALPDLAENAQNQAAVRESMQRLFGPNGPARQMDWKEIPAALRKSLPSDLTLAEPNPNILCRHHVIEGRTVYFLASVSPDPQTIHPRFATPGSYAIYRPITGVIEPTTATLEIKLEAYEGVFVVGGIEKK